jgi:hypothetical protein
VCGVLLHQGLYLFEQFPIKNLKKQKVTKNKIKIERRKPLLVDGRNKFISMLGPKWASIQKPRHIAC